MNNYPFSHMKFFILTLFLCNTAQVNAEGDLDDGIWVGYQAWHLTGKPNKREGWYHWFKSGEVIDIKNFHGDQWPGSLKEYPKLHDTGLRYPNGEPVMVYSSSDYETIDLHVKWMKEYGIKGLALQRQQNLIDKKSKRLWRDVILKHVMRACEKHGVYFFLMPCNNAKSEKANIGVVKRFKDDWKHLVDNLKVTESPMYAKQEGKPVIIMWGLGFENRPITPVQASEIIDFFKNGDEKYQVYLGAGVQRGFTSENKKISAWREVYKKVDLLKTWRTVQKVHRSEKAMKKMISGVRAEKAWCDKYNIEYMPVIFAGGSWHGKNHFPRNGGQYFWKQFSVVMQHIFQPREKKFIYIAMFDEIDEGTATYKTAHRPESLPDSSRMVYNNIDKNMPLHLQDLPEDWYLLLANAMASILQGKKPMSSEIPIRP